MQLLYNVMYSARSMLREHHVLSDQIRARESIKRLISVENRAVFMRNFELPRG